MSHVTGLFARRGFNLEAIVCVPVDDGATSGMLLLVADEPRLEQVERQLAKLYDVLAIRHRADLTPHVLSPAGRGHDGRVASSSRVRESTASPRLPPHISSVGRSLTHTSGRSDCPNRAQRKSGSSCTHGMPAGFPNGMPGIDELIDGATQQAPQCGLQSIPGGKITPAA